MRRVAAASAALLLAAAGCSRLAQQQDTLAPRVAPAEAPGSAGASKPAGAIQVPTSASVSCADQAGSNPCQVSTVQPSAPSSSATSATAATAAQAASQASAPAAVASPAAPAPAASPTTAPITVAPIASRVLLQPVQHEYETWNNCAPVTAEMVLSYYGVFKRQTEIAPVLRPNPKNFSVRMDQIAAYLGQFGLESQPLIGGTLSQLKALVSNNIPVVVEDQLSLQEDYGHFRMVRGFDDSAGVLIFGDSYYGPTNRLTYALYQELWKRHNYGFMPVFKPDQRALVQAILGRDFDPKQNLQDALAEAQQAAGDHPDDGYAWLNLGNDLYRAGELQGAKNAWERAQRLSITARTLWYTTWPAAVYNQLGQFQNALQVVAIPLATDPNNAEALLERGNAYRGLGNKDRARSDYALAYEIDPSLLPAKQALQSLQ
jgi:tetratricopeptide (TPR) repeat protein